MQRLSERTKGRALARAHWLLCRQMHSTTPVGISGVMKRLQSRCGCSAPLTTSHSRDQVWCACSNCLVALRSVRSALAPRLLSVVSSLAHANEAAALFLLLGVEIDQTKNGELEAGGQRGLRSRVEVCTGWHGGCKIRGSRCARSATAATLRSSNGGTE